MIRPATDCLAWGSGFALAVASHREWDLGEFWRGDPVLVATVAATVQLALGYATGLYRGRHDVRSLDEALLLTGTVLGTGLGVTGLVLLMPEPGIPRSSVLAATVIALVLGAGARFLYGHRRDQVARPDVRTAARVVVYGAGRTGQQLVRSMMADTDGGYRPVALLDDDPALRRRRICGVPVCGTSHDAGRVARARGADLLVVAMRAPDLETVRRVTAAADEVGLRVQVLPPLEERLRPTVGMADVRDLDVNVLLGRIPIGYDDAAVLGVLAGRRVLVTGAGGSIGSELCRQIARHEPAELTMLDRDESALHAVQLSLYGMALLDSPDVVLADLRDADAIDEVFRRRRPEIVFHAAALKHLPMLEQYPEEGWKTNVLGTATVLEVAHRHGVAKLVNISTDKAAAPISVLGRSKRVGERLVAGAAARGDDYVSVRFGNVLGSRGSVLHTFHRQLTDGEPLTITHPHVSRYFMTIPEAVHLVLQAAAVGAPGEVLVLDMGERVPVVEVARQLMDLSGLSSPIVYTGLRAGEKLHEELLGPDEVDHRPHHPLISQVAVPALGVAETRAVGTRLGGFGAMVALCRGATAAIDAPTRPMLADDRRTSGAVRS